MKTVAYDFSECYNIFTSCANVFIEVVFACYHVKRGHIKEGNMNTSFIDLAIL